MKTPKEIIWYPLDTKEDETGGVWYYVPGWIVRGMGLKGKILNLGRVQMVIRSFNRARIEWGGEEDCATEYWKRNWCKKIAREKRTGTVSQ